MKKFLFAAAILFSTSAFSQSVWHWGVKGGANFSFSKVTVNSNKITAGTRPGFFGGGILEFSPGDSDSHIKLQLEALYNDMNVNYPMQSIGKGLDHEKINLRQISVPLLMKIVVITPLTINIGPTFNTNIGGKEKLIEDGGSIDKKFNKDNYKSFQFGGIIGASYTLYKNFFVDARYNKQFGHANNINDGKIGFEYLNPNKVKWDDVQVGIGYMF
ncbi:MAG: porin family protein [Arachidicoccus sp.]|nr:porin family protein [Arachidicoccus sp.]